MKKILIILLLMLFSFAYSKTNYQNYCAQIPPDKTIHGAVMSATGLNLISRLIIEHKIEQALKNETGSKFKVNVSSWWGVSNLNGEVRAFSAYAKEYSHNGFYAKDLNIETFCDYTKIGYDDSKLTFKYSTVLKYSATITKDHFKSMMKSSDYTRAIGKALSFINIDYTDYLDAVKILKNTKWKIKVDKGFYVTLFIENAKYVNNMILIDGHIIIPKTAQ